MASLGGTSASSPTTIADERPGLFTGAGPRYVQDMPLDENEINDATQKILRRAALAMQGMVLRRAFPDSGPGRDVNDRVFPPLERDYGHYKSATRPYVSAETRAAAMKKRALSGKPGIGPLVDVLGIRTRLGPRHNASNQRLTDLTAKAIGIVRESPGSVVLGFRDERSQRVAGHLQRRNNFFGLTSPERRAIVAQIEREMRALVDRSFTIAGGKFSINLL